MYTITQIGSKIKVEGEGVKMNFHDWYSAVNFIKKNKINIINTESIPEYYRQILFN